MALVGLGAVGGFCLEVLARCGIGNLTLVDFDTFEPSNLNRQILAVESSIGELKTAAACERVLSINPDASVTVFPEKCCEENVQAIVAGKDLVIDAIDDVDAKCLLLKTCWSEGIPVISSMGAARKTDPSRIAVTDLMKTHTCPLARAVRTRLRSEGVGKGITVVYSDEEPSQAGTVLGSMASVTGSFGLRLGHLAIESLLSACPCPQTQD